MWRFAANRPLLLATFGACEGAFFPLVFYSAARLPGAVVQVLCQVLIPGTVVFSFLVLRRRCDATQLAGVGVTLVGVLLAISPAAGASALVRPRLLHVAMCAAAYVLMSLAMVVKELAFLRYWEAEEGPPLSVPLFLTAGTLSRAVALVLCWPLFLRAVAPGAQVLRSALTGLSAIASPGILLLAAFFWTCNVGMSVTTLLLVRQTSASTTVLANVFAMPLGALLFCCPLPLLDRQPFHLAFVASLALVVVGNLLYSHEAWRKKPCRR